MSVRPTFSRGTPLPRDAARSDDGVAQHRPGLRLDVVDRRDKREEVVNVMGVGDDPEPANGFSEQLG